jgi:sarcosine oxidase, subunit gamma
MSEVSALAGAVTDGATRVEEAGLQGMVTLKGDLGSAKMKAALKSVRPGLPAQRGIVEKDGRAVAWMARDEVLILCDYGEANAVVAGLETALAGEHFLAVIVSDARAMFRVTGPGAREAVAKVAPVDLHPESFKAGEMRRTRLAQVAGAIWLSDEDQISVIAFRSVARYVFDILTISARDDAEVGYFS